MESKQFSEYYTAMHPSQQLNLLLDLSHQLTVFARSAYAKVDPQRGDVLARINEFQHRIASSAKSIANESAGRSATDVASIIFSGFEDIGAITTLDLCVARGKKIRDTTGNAGRFTGGAE